MQKTEPGNNRVYAGLWLRIMALASDFILLSLVFSPVTRIVKGVWIMSAGEHGWNYGWFVTDPLCLVFLAVIVLYFVLLEGILGVTAGKRIFGIQVIGIHGEKPGIRKALIRNLLRAVDALPAFSILGIALIAISPECARFGDRIAGTRVILRCQ